MEVVLGGSDSLRRDLEATWQSSAWSWRPHGSRFGGFHEHLEFSEFKIWVTDLLQRSVLKDVSNEITVQVGSKEALCRVCPPLPPQEFPWVGRIRRGK